MRNELRTIITFILLMVAAPSAYAEGCSFDTKKIGIGKLGYYESDGRLNAVSKARKMVLSRSDSDNANFAFYFPAASSRKGGMLLVKVIDYVDTENDGKLPDYVYLSRSASKRYAWFGRFVLSDVKKLELGKARTSVLEYQLANSLIERINPTGDLARFLESYAVGKINRDVFSKELRKRIFFAFEDVILNLDEKKRRALNVALANIPTESFVRKALAKAVSDDTFLKPSVTSKKYIKNLQARLYYYGNMGEGSGLNVCFKHSPDSSVTRSRFVVVDNDADGGRRAEEFGSFDVEWR